MLEKTAMNSQERYERRIQRLAERLNTTPLAIHLRISELVYIERCAGNRYFNDTSAILRNLERQARSPRIKLTIQDELDANSSRPTPAQKGTGLPWYEELLLAQHGRGDNCQVAKPPRREPRRLLTEQK